MFQILTAVLPVVLGAAAGGCTGGQGSSGAGELFGEKQIGDFCEPEDGWQREPLVVDEEERAAAEEEGRPFGVHPPEGYQSSPSVGVRYCMVSEIAFPNGYFTASCREDADCAQSDAVCVVGLCRRKCHEDDDCALPYTCVESDATDYLGDAVHTRYCQCDTCGGVIDRRRP